MLFKPKEFENSGFSFSCGRKAFWKRSFSKMMVSPESCDFPDWDFTNSKWPVIVAFWAGLDYGRRCFGKCFRKASFWNSPGVMCAGPQVVASVWTGHIEVGEFLFFKRAEFLWIVTLSHLYLSRICCALFIPLWKRNALWAVCGFSRVLLILAFKRRFRTIFYFPVSTCKAMNGYLKSLF